MGDTGNRFETGTSTQYNFSIGIIPDIYTKDGREPKLFVGPGEKMVLLGNDGRALFVWRKYKSDDGQTGINCAVFRNEGERLSSEILLEAESIALLRWPGHRMFTYINPRKIQSQNPGYCFKGCRMEVYWRNEKTKTIDLRKVMKDSIFIDGDFNDSYEGRLKRMKNGKSLPALQKEADELVSLFVRKNAANTLGMVECISCGKLLYWKEADCAHFVDRKHTATRYLLESLAPACVDCNRFNEDRHIAAWEAKMGKEKAEALRMKARTYNKWMRFEYEETIAMLKKMLKVLDGK